MEELSIKKRVRDELDESEIDSPDVKRIREDLLNNLDDSDLCTESEDLESFMKSFEEEISGSPSHATVVDLTSDSGESQPDLGFLLGASDDELGLPPSNTSPNGVEYPEENELVRVSSELSELWGFEDHIPSYDSFEYGIGVTDSHINGNGEYVALEGLFDYSDLGFGSDLWRPETLPAQ
ncbi:unnamed protein product [Ilex paraguariensis]|uniref:Uncharacterized protein n=1 Tax=Ilex paraguariensis TaxID=185542 RepID=A0ABC8SF21_9AQUA